MTLFQHLHCKLGFSAPPLGAGFDEKMEWRRNKPLPLPNGADRRTWLQYYLDDFDSPEVVAQDEAEELYGSVSDLQARQRQAYAHNGVAWAPSKSHERETKVERMGAWVDGEWGRVSAPLGKNT